MELHGSMLSTITLYKLPAEIKLIVRLNINEVNLWDLRERVSGFSTLKSRHRRFA